MTTTTTSTRIDEARVEQFAGQLLTDFAAAAATAMTVSGCIGPWPAPGRAPRPNSPSTPG